MFRLLRVPPLLASGVSVCFSFIVSLATTSATGALDMKLVAGTKPDIVFDTAHDHCDATDMPDVDARAFRDADGDIVMFALYDMNRPLRGEDLAHLSLDCHVVLASRFDPAPAHYDERNVLAATWTADGRDIAALIHHEYHADMHASCAISGFEAVRLRWSARQKRTAASRQSEGELCPAGPMH